MHALLVNNKLILTCMTDLYVPTLKYYIFQQLYTRSYYMSNIIILFKLTIQYIISNNYKIHFTQKILSKTLILIIFK